MTLEACQLAFWRAVRSAQGPRELTGCCPGGEISQATLERVLVYRRAYWVRQIEALGDEFRRLAHRLGQQQFSALMEEYIAAHPSEDPRIEWIGRHLPRFLYAHPDPARRALADLAAFEWAEVEALLAEDPDLVTARFDIPADAFPQCTLTFVPSFRILSLAADPLADEEHGAGSTCYAVWRKGFAVHHRRLDPDEHQAAIRVKSGLPVERVFEAFASLPDPAGRAAVVFRGWLTDEWVSRIAPPQQGSTP